MATRLTWIALLGAVLAVASHLFFGSIFVSAERTHPEFIVMDAFTPENTHELSGMVLVPSACHDLSVRTYDIDADSIMLVFETWKQPYRECMEEPVPRAFKVVSFAPENISLEALIDGMPVSMRVQKDIH